MTASPSYVPERGDLVWMDFSPHAGYEQGGRRPALVISPASYNGRVGLGLFCPITSHVKGYPFEVDLPAGLPISGVVLVDQIKSFDWRARSTEFAGRLPARVVTAALSRLRRLV